MQFWFEAKAAEKQAQLLRPKGWKEGKGPSLLQSHGWIDGTLQDTFDSSAFDASDRNTWPLVQPKPDVHFETRAGQRATAEKAAVNHRASQIREPQQLQPLLSFVFVRWGGKYSAWMDEQESNDGDWGKYGSPPSDEYMTALVKEGLLAHPRLLDDEGQSHNFEVFNLFVKSSADMWEVADKAPQLSKCLRGKKRTLFWMLWPAEWEDTGDLDFACYVERQALFSAMRCCEAAGLPSGFPHPADQFEMITSKSWMATLSLHPLARLPACVLVSKDKVLTDLPTAASDALAALEHVRRLCPSTDGGEVVAPHAANREKITKGVVKLGWSWENRFVSVWNTMDQLKARLKDMMSQPGCTASYCIVQEFVDFDFEMRQYYLPPMPVVPGARLEPTRIECNAWGERSAEQTVGQSHASFSKLKETDCLERWSQDRKAWEAAKAQCTEVAQFVVAWLLTVNARPVPMIRLDFMLKRTGPGKARVFFGEYCEMGACCLGWKEGPPTIWRAALDAALR